MTAVERLMRLRHSLPRIEVGYGFPSVTITYSPPVTKARTGSHARGLWVVAQQTAYHRTWKRDSAHKTLELAALRAIELRKKGARQDYRGQP
jgi:hypothetical protein